MNAIETHGLSKRYGSFWALQQCSIEIPQGSVCGLVGANGAGKSTLIKMLAGLSRQTEGTATVAGQTPSDDKAFLSEIGYLAQEVPMYPRFTVEDHLRMAAHLNVRWDDAATRQRLKDLAIPFDRRVSALSGGMRSQVALALALGKQPRVLILDEPVAALDPLARKDFLAALSGAVVDAEGELTVLMSSHLLADLERVCDHLVLISDARAVLCDDIDHLVATHKVLTGPPAEAPAGVEVIEHEQTPRQSSLLVRVDGPVRAEGWQVDEAGLEEIVLAYLGKSSRRKAAAA